VLQLRGAGSFSRETQDLAAAEQERGQPEVREELSLRECRFHPVARFRGVAVDDEEREQVGDYAP